MNYVIKFLHFCLVFGISKRLQFDLPSSDYACAYIMNANDSLTTII